MSSNNVHYTATLNYTTPNYTYWHFTSSHLHFTTLPFGLTHQHFLSFYFTSHPQTYFQSNEPLHCPKELLSISLFIFFYLIWFFPTFPINLSLHFTLLFTSTDHFPSLFCFLSPVLLFPNPRFENMSFTVGSPYRPFR
jgi:hypothetical protein